MKFLNLLIIPVVIAFLALGGCSKESSSEGPTTADSPAMTAPYDGSFVEDFSNQVTNPIVPTMGDVHLGLYLRFLVRYLGLQPDQIASVQELQRTLQGCLRGVRAGIKDGTYDTRQEVIDAIKLCNEAYKTSFEGLLTEEQLVKWNRLKQHRRGVAPSSELFDEMALNIPHDDATLEQYENSMVFSAGSGMTVLDHGPRGLIGFLIRYLRLTDEQIANAKTAAQAYVQALKDIRDQVKNGELTRREAMTEMLDARKAMMESIYSTLDDTQKAKWNRIFKRR